MHIFFQPDLTLSQIILNEEESKHCVRVLRLKKSDAVELIDGKGISAIAKIIDDNPKKCYLQIETVNHKPQTRNYKLHIAVAPTKNFDRMEWFIEKAVEVGVDEISFIRCENSERTKINFERCEKIAISALKQSKQYWLPKINDVGKFNEVMKGLSNEGIKLVAFCETEITQTLHTLIPSSTHPQNIVILIGPEGDFTKAEIDLALQHHFKPVSFGENRLRTETAALYACMAVNALLQK